MKSQYLLGKILLTGAVTLGLELAVSRILTPFFGVSLFVWSAVLSVTLIALALGYKYGGVLALRATRQQILLTFAGAGGMAALWMVLCLWTYPYLFWPLANFHLVMGSIAASMYLLFIPLVILSAMNPLLVALLSDEEKASKGDHGAGSVFFLSTIGSVLGVFVVAFGMLPYLTNYKTVVILTLISSTASLLLLWVIRDTQTPLFRKLFGLSLLAFLLAAGTLVTGGLERTVRSESAGNGRWRLVDSMPSSFGNLQVVDFFDGEGNKIQRALLNDGMLQNVFYPTGASSALYTYALERLALAAVPEPKKALVLGIGAGVVPTILAQDDIAVHAVDISHNMVAMAERHFDFHPKDFGITIDIADARTAARQCQPDNDIVVIDLFRDDGSPEHLVTREFFADIKNCLKDDGVIVMNSFVRVSNPVAEYALIQTIADVFGEVYYVPRAADPGSEFGVAYLVARKGAPVGKLDVSLNNMPPAMAHELSTALRASCVFTKGDPALGGAPVLTDMANQWKHLAHADEVAYRQVLVSRTTWQILLN